MTGHKFKAGMYLLETLTSGMYNDPLSIYREYVQNSVDAIDQSNLSPGESKIDINLDPFSRSVTIRDNGPGIAAEVAEQTLSSIGSSGKVGTQLRGFRGIGRLGGIAFARKVVFKTAAEGENVTSIQEWDCDGLRSYLNSAEHASMTIEDLFAKISSFRQEERKAKNKESYFEVKLLEVGSFRNYIFDIQKVKNYLVDVSPLPFSRHTFSHYDEVSCYLKSKIPHYGEYKIFVNGEQLFRPYRDTLSITSKKKGDCLDGVELFELSSQGKALAYGWYGLRRDLLGAISKGEGFSGIRVKVGNIQIGDNHLLDRCFREPRFNSYFVGEIHVIDRTLSPNSRRDDFVDNDSKTELYNAIEKEIGLPLSKEVRERSRLKMKGADANEYRRSGCSVVRPCEMRKEENLKEIQHKVVDGDDQRLIEHLLLNCGDCEKLKIILAENKN